MPRLLTAQDGVSSQTWTTDEFPAAASADDASTQVSSTTTVRTLRQRALGARIACVSCLAAGRNTAKLSFSAMAQVRFV